MWTSPNAVPTTTIGGPAPSTVYAMLTPSLVVAYWMRGSITPLSHRPHLHPLPHPLQALFAAVLKLYARRRPRQRAHRLRHQHLARCGEPADARRDVDRAPVDVVASVWVFLARDIAGVQAQVQGQTGVIAGLAAAQRRLDCLSRRCEHCEHAIPQRRPFDGPPTALADKPPQRGAELACLRAEGGIAEALGQRGGVGDVREEDGGHAGRELRRGRGRLLAFTQESVDRP